MPRRSVLIRRILLPFTERRPTTCRAFPLQPLAPPSTSRCTLRMSEASRYDYELPKELVAQQPLARRADARLMLIDRARRTIAHHHVRDLPELLQPEDCLVINDTRVVPARLVGSRTQTQGVGRGCSSRPTLKATGGCWHAHAADRAGRNGYALEPSWPRRRAAADDREAAWRIVDRTSRDRRAEFRVA